MNAWINIGLFPHDPDIIKMNAFEARLGEIPDNIYNVCELITRHEVCHFKYKKQIEKSDESLVDCLFDENNKSTG